MPEITDILAIFGRVDQIASENFENPLVEATVERLLPGTAGYHQGWYAQVERFLQTASGLDSSPLPEFHTAVASLGEAEPGLSWPVPQQAKARYAATVLTELHRTINGEVRFDEDEELFALANVLAVGSTLNDAGETFLSLIYEERPSHANWHQFIEKAAAMNLVSEEEARMTPPARGKIRAIGNEFCTQLDTPYEDPKLDITKVAAVIDPQNWVGCCPYWKTVKEVVNPANPAGWTRIYEVVHAKTDLGDVELTTPLIYRNHEVGGGVVVNYDLDTDLRGTQHDDFVCADSGYIWATPITKGQNPSGVRVHTRKVARIQGLGVAALAMFAYSMGWSTAGENLILGCAKNPPKNSKPFKATPPAKATTPNLAPKVPPIPNVGERERKQFVDKVVNTLTKALDDRSTKTGELVQRWVDGELMPTDVIAAGSDAGIDLVRTHTKLHVAAGKTIPTPDKPPATPLKKAAKKAAAKKVVPPKKVPPKKPQPPKGGHK